MSSVSATSLNVVLKSLVNAPADAVNPRPFRFDDKSQTNRRVRTKTKEKKSEFRRKTAKVEVMKIVETINIVDRLQKPVRVNSYWRNWVGVFSNSISCSIAEKDRRACQRPPSSRIRSPFPLCLDVAALGETEYIFGSSS